MKMDPEGIEPSTSSLKDSCSTNWAKDPNLEDFSTNTINMVSSLNWYALKGNRTLICWLKTNWSATDLWEHLTMPAPKTGQNCPDIRFQRYRDDYFLSITKTRRLTTFRQTSSRESHTQSSRESHTLSREEYPFLNAFHQSQQQTSWCNPLTLPRWCQH